MPAKETVKHLSAKPRQAPAPVNATRAPKPPPKSADVGAPARFEAGPAALRALMFAVLAAVLWRLADPSLSYQLGFYAHSSGAIMGFPGFHWEEWPSIWGLDGLNRFISNGLLQTQCYSLLGALTLAAMALLIDLCLVAALERMGIRHSGLARVLALLAQTGAWASRLVYAGAVTGALLGLAAALAALVLRPRNLWLRLAALAGWSAFLVVAAPGGWLVFVPVLVFFELRSGSDWVWTAAFLGLAVAAIPLAGAAFGYGAREAFELVIPAGLSKADYFLIRAALRGCGLPDSAVVPAACVGLLYAALAFCGPLALLEGRVAGWLEARRHPLKSRAWAGPALAAAAVVGVALGAQDSALRTFLTVETRAAQGRWEDVLRAAEGSSNALVQCAAAQAAFHTGALLKRLPVLNNPAGLLPPSTSEAAQWRLADLYYDLGYANMALHCASEASESWDERPILLRRLAVVNLALGNVETAKICLKRLRSIPFQSGWAADWLNRIEADPSMSLDPEVSRLRRSMPRTDTVAEMPANKQLELLLAANRSNRMAFEYLITSCLLTRDFESLLRYIRGARFVPGLEIPPLWQEGLVVAEMERGVQAEGISPETRRRFEQFKNIVRANASNIEGARAQVQSEYADSYFFYYTFKQ